MMREGGRERGDREKERKKTGRGIQIEKKEGRQEWGNIINKEKERVLWGRENAMREGEREREKERKKEKKGRGG